MGMGIGENGRAGTVLHKNLQDAVGIAALFTTRIELSIAVSSCPTLAKAVVALGVNTLLGADARNVLLSLAHILSPLYDNWLETQLDKAQGCEQSTRSGTYDDNRRTVADIAIDVGFKVLKRWFLTNVCPNGQVDVDGALTGIDAATKNTDSLGIDAFILAKISEDALFVICLLWQDAKG